MRILLVEDNPGDVRLTEEALFETKSKHQLDHVPDGEAALKYLKQESPYEGSERPDLIFLDLNLPKIGGLEVLKRIKHDPSLNSIPILILTTSEAEQDIQKAYTSRANCYITKPVDINQFIKVIQEVENYWFGITNLPD